MDEGVAGCGSCHIGKAITLQVLEHTALVLAGTSVQVFNLFDSHFFLPIETPRRKSLDSSGLALFGLLVAVHVHQLLASFAKQFQLADGVGLRVGAVEHHALLDQVVRDLTLAYGKRCLRSVVHDGPLAGRVGAVLHDQVKELACVHILADVRVHDALAAGAFDVEHHTRVMHAVLIVVFNVVNKVAAALDLAHTGGTTAAVPTVGLQVLAKVVGDARLPLQAFERRVEHSVGAHLRGHEFLHNEPAADEHEAGESKLERQRHPSLDALGDRPGLQLSLVGVVAVPRLLLRLLLLLLVRVAASLRVLSKSAARSSSSSSRRRRRRRRVGRARARQRPRCCAQQCALLVVLLVVG